jgi:DNA-binding winged helix-turn-helix (wHTH) protein/TolB-like protein/tetratricopeptide (TPR) repeat protein
MDRDLQSGFRLGEWYVCPKRNCIASEGNELHLESKVMAVLAYLSGRQGEVVSKTELLDHVWRNQTVAEGVVTRAVYELRRALDDDANKPRYIENVPRIGYRLLEQPQPLTDADNRPSIDTRRWLKMASAALMVLVVSMLAFQLLLGNSGLPAIRSVAVLPFVNMTGGSDKDYISDGLTEEVIHVIAHQPALSVSARTSSFALRDQGLTAEEIGQRLGVDSIIEGSVREERGLQRITVQLIDIRTQAHRGSVTLDIVDGNLFAAQSRLAEVVTDMLRDAGADVRPVPVEKSTTDEIKVYELYLRGRAALQIRSGESLRAAREFLLEATRIDDTFAPAHASLAQLHLVARAYLGIGVEETRDLAEASLRRALAYDPNNVEALVVSAALTADAGNYDEALQLFDRAIELQPSHAIAYLWRGEVLHTLGYLQVARESVETAVRLDPFAGSTNTVMAKAQSFFPDDERMLTAAKQAEAFDARLAPKFLALHYFRNGDTQGFARELHRYHEVLGIPPEATDLLLRAARNELEGDPLSNQLDRYAIRRNNYFALELAMLGQHSAALAALLRWPSHEGTFIDDMWLPEFKKVRALPGFHELIRRMGLDDYWRTHALPDVCNNRAPEPICNLLLVDAGT